MTLRTAVIYRYIQQFEGRLARHAFGLAFLGVSALLMLAPWLHPPLSADIRPKHLSLGLTEAVDPEEILHGPRPIPADNVSIVLIAAFMFAAGIVGSQRERDSTAAGLLLSVAIVVDAALVFNQPALIEAMDMEYAQRQQMVAMRTLSPEPHPTVLLNNGRLGLLAAPLGDEQPGDLTRGPLYLHAGLWLLLWAAVGVMATARGTLPQRLLNLALWTVCASAVAAAICFHRLQAEWHWLQAQQCEAACDYDGARANLARTIAAFPDLARLERTWLLAGKVDFRSGRATAYAIFFEASQLQRDRDRLRSVTYQEDLPWMIRRTPDYREGLATLPAGFNLTLPTGTAEIGTSDFRAGFVSPKGPLTYTYWAAHPRDYRHALERMNELLVTTGNDPTVRRATGRLWVERGLDRYLKGPVFTEDGFSHIEQARSLSGAQQEWRQASVLIPTQLDWPFYLGTTAARLDPNHPEQAEHEMAPLLGAIGDQVIKADALSTLGDAYFDASQFSLARDRYAQSFRAFSLPTLINYRAQKGLGGQ